MANQARVTDVTVGLDHSCVGILLTGSPNATSEGQPQSRMTDISIQSCGDVGVVLTCSGMTTSEGLGNARLSDILLEINGGMAIIASGSPNTMVD